MRENGLGQLSPFSLMAMLMAALTVEMTRFVDILVMPRDIRWSLNFAASKLPSFVMSASPRHAFAYPMLRSVDA
jgi:hypothetical protein